MTVVPVVVYVLGKKPKKNRREWGITGGNGIQHKSWNSRGDSIIENDKYTSVEVLRRHDVTLSPVWITIHAEF